MRSAPAVTVRCTGGPLWRLSLWLLPALAAAALIHWMALHAGSSPAASLGAALLGAAAAAVVATRSLPPAVQLNWDGAVWTCGVWPVQPQVMVDTGGAWLLLRLRPAGPATAQSVPPSHAAGGRAPRWLPVSQRDAGPAWHALRAAVYCRPPESPPDGEAR